MEELIMEDSIIRAVKLDTTDEVNNLNLLLEKEVKTVPAGYHIAQIQPLDDNIVLLGFIRTQHETVNGLPKASVPTPKGLQEAGPSTKQLNYLVKLVDSLQPDDFPGINEITTSRLASKWIGKLKKQQSDDRSV